MKTTKLYRYIINKKYISNFPKLPIAVARGDGIGPEIMKAVLTVFDAAKVPLDYKFVDIGKSVYMKGNSTGMTTEARNTVESLGILFKGPMETPKGKGIKSINVTARKLWNTYANKRIFKTLPGVETVFTKCSIPIDLTLFRENIEDTYGGIEHYQTNDVVQCRRLITKPGSVQIHKMAFEFAQSKKANRITCVHKANIMKLTDGIFLETFNQIAKEYPNLRIDDAIVDDLAMKLVMKPNEFDILVLPNLQGDIISDLCAGLVGGLGMAPSANLGDSISIFEAVHGTAPDIVGKEIANPTALLLSGIMMLRHLGLSDNADWIQHSLERTLKLGERTMDLVQVKGKQALKTNQFVGAIINNLPPQAKFINIVIPFEPIIKPKENIILATNRDKNIEKTVGVDIFVDSESVPSKIAKKIKESLSSDYELVMISNRGTQVWPTGSVFTECVNHYRCRIQLKDINKLKTTETELLSLICKISKNIRICSLEMLLLKDGKQMYTLAQGQ
jgi:isocitrate dehydrogenase